MTALLEHGLRWKDGEGGVWSAHVEFGELSGFVYAAEVTDESGSLQTISDDAAWVLLAANEASRWFPGLTIIKISNKPHVLAFVAEKPK